MSVITFRPLERTDGELLSRFFGRLSQESLYRRFMSPIHHVDQVNDRRLLDIDHEKREAVIGLLAGEVIGVARYARSDLESGIAECAVVVADRFQRVGIATQLLSRLAILALGRGITEFTFNAQSHNLPLIRLVRKVVGAPSLRFIGPEVEGRFDIIDLTSYSPLYRLRELDGQQEAPAEIGRP